MADYTLDDAKDRLPDLVERARAGEDVVLTEDGRIVAELRPRPTSELRPGRPMTPADWDWLDERRGQMSPNVVDAATFVRRMRDEDWA